MLSPEVERFLDACKRLRVDAAIGPPKPYKPLMLAAVVLLIGKGKIVTPDVFLDGGLRSVCRQLLERLYPSWPYRFDARYPFRIWSATASGRSCRWKGDSTSFAWRGTSEPGRAPS